MSQRPPGSSADAIHAVTRLLDAALDAPGPSSVHQLLVDEAFQLLGATEIVLLAVDRRERFARVVAAAPYQDPPAARVALDAIAPLADLVDQRHPHARARGIAAAQLGRAVGWPKTDDILLLGLRSRDAVDHVLACAVGRLDGPAEEVAMGFSAAAGAALAQLRLAEEQAARHAEQASLARAGKTLNERGLDLPAVLSAICHEARAILDGDNGVVYRGSHEGITIEAAVGLPPDAVGQRLTPGTGLSGRVVQSGRSLLTNDYQRVVKPVPGSLFAAVQSCIAVPMHWDGELRGVLSVGFNRPRFVGARDLALLEAFAELAAAACRNASAAAGLARAARTDALTGCLNRAALEEILDAEVERAERTGRPLSLILVDLDNFKQVNEQAGHLVGDEVLRRVGHALNTATRPYDMVARYGGDEFAILAVDAGERNAHELAARAIERVHEALLDLGEVVGTVATAGVAQRSPGGGPRDLVEAADRALLYGKQEQGRGHAVCVSDVDPSFRPLASPATLHTRIDRPRRSWEDSGSLRLQRRTRQLAMANQLGTRLAAMTEVSEIVEAVCEELHQAFGFFLCAAVVIREDDYVEGAALRGEAFLRLGDEKWSQPREAGVIGRCLRERRVLLIDDVYAEPGYVCTGHTADVRSELVAPVWVGDRLWGVLNLEELTVGAFDEDDAQLLQTVADLTGSALRGALLYEALERAYLGTAEALAAALEAKDSYTAEHARSIVDWADAVGSRLGMTDAQRRDLRYGAVFHDIGKIAIPEEILNKRGPLTRGEREVVQRHTIIGEQILQPVDFLRDVLPIVRHEHERWDGTGYPDRLAGEAIPLGARIVFVCDAYHAMTSTRPYRRAMDPRDAMAELRAGAGSQFDPAVVKAFLAVLDEAEAEAEAEAAAAAAAAQPSSDGAPSGPSIVAGTS